MKKKVLASVLMIAGLVSSAPVFAQNEVSGTPAECTVAPCPMPQNIRKAAGPFDGLNLSDKQKAQLDELCKANCAEREKVAKDTKDRKEHDRVARMENGRKMRADNLEKIKKILDKKQYLKFLENQYVNGNNDMGKIERAGQKARRADAKKMRRDSKKIRHADARNTSDRRKDVK